MIETVRENGPLDPLRALLYVNSIFNTCATTEDTGLDTCLREVNFMSYELSTLCHSQADSEVFQTLNNFLFSNKNFKISARPILLKPLLENRTGSNIAFAFLYIHLAKCLDLKMQLVHWPLHAILKWESSSGKTRFVDLEQKGKTLCEEELLSMVNRHIEQVRTLSFREAYIQYLAAIAQIFREDGDGHGLHKALNEILQVDAENTRFLSERALLRKELGLLKESLADFKRYFAFTDVLAAPPEVVIAYETVLIDCT